MNGRDIETTVSRPFASDHPHEEIPMAPITKPTDDQQPPADEQTAEITREPRVGDVVDYLLTAQDVATVARQRAALGTLRANGVNEGDLYPAIVVRVWTGELVNLQVFLDGPDSLWVTSAHLGTTWEWRS